ncbi:AAA family ATPase [Moraxella sp. VT-16-12]|nr:ATP-binding protein [Moraxella sp. VT-16-12]TWV80433.1 AAA family ATPase [Moraxella sp. VT-16-12]
MKLPTLQPRLKPATTHTPKRNWGKGRGGRPWRRLKDEILARDLYTCQHCGRVGGQLELDHIVNTANGGTDDPSNLQILCHDCHKVKTQAESRDDTYVFMPDWLKPIPNAILLFGPAGSGKSTWAKQHGTGFVIIDLDEIIAKQTGKPIYVKDEYDFMQGVRLRNELLMQMTQDNTPCIIILTGSTQKQRDWWIKQIKPHKVVIMDTPADECIRRIKADDRRPDDVKERHISSVHTWWGASKNLSKPFAGHHAPPRA